MSSFSCYDSKKSEWQQTLTIAREVVDSIEKQVETLKQQADNNVGTIMPVEYIGRMFSNRSEIKYYKGTYDTYNSAADRARKFALETYNKALEIHTKNIIAIDNNKQIIKRIKSIMNYVGIFETYSMIDSKSRARCKPYIKHQAGYIDDLNRTCKTDDGWSLCESDYHRMVSDIDKYIQECVKQEEKEKFDKQRIEASKENELKRAALVVKYQLDYTASWEKILDVILGKDKYLRLAHYLQMNRSDWSAGYYYAKCGLSVFAIENDIDREIHDEIQSLITDWDGDGRCFRDCKWNYNVIFGLVTDPLLKYDYDIALSNND